MSGNPYLAGYESLFRQLGDGASSQPAADYAAPRLRTPAVFTQAPQPSQQPQHSGQLYMQSHQGVSVSVGPAIDAGSSIDIVLPQPAPHHGSAMASSSGMVHVLVPGGPSGQADVEVSVTAQAAEAADAAAVSALQGLTVTQMLDLDVDNLAVKIDRYHCQTKKGVLDHFMDFKARLMQAQNEAVDEERRQCAARLAAKDEELNLTRAELSGATLRGQRLLEMLCKSCDALDSAKQRRRDLLMLFQAFYSWRQHAMASAQRQRRMQRAEEWYTQVHLKKNVFKAWFWAAMRQHRITLANRYQQQLEVAKQAMHEQYQGQIAELERRLADTHAQLAIEAEARNRLEDNMKRAFMRGVCALNIEAMSIMKRGAPAGGANPFPISLAPPAPEQQTGAAGTRLSGSEAMSRQAAALSEPFNLDLHGSITLSPTRLPAMGSATGATMQGASITLSQAGPGPAQTSASGVRFAVGPAVASSSGGGQPAVAVVKASQQSAPSSDAGPVVRETAQAYYQQRPAVLVTRGPANEVPKPRPGPPLPTVRQM